MLTRTHRRPSALISLLLALIVALSGVPFDGPRPAQAATPGTITADDEPCQAARPGQGPARPACPGGQTATPPRLPDAAGRQPANPARVRGNGQVSAQAGPAGSIYVFDNFCCPTDPARPGAIILVDPSKPAGADQAIVSKGQQFKSPFAGALGNDGMIYVLDILCCAGGKGGVIKVDPSQPSTSNQTIVSEGVNFAQPQSIALGADGLLYVTDGACCAGGTGGVIRTDLTQPAASNQTIVSEGQNFGFPVGIIPTAGGKLIVVATGSKTLVLVDPSQPKGNNQTQISVGQTFVSPLNVAQTADGLLYVTDSQCCAVNTSVGAVIQVDPSKPKDSNQKVTSNGEGFLVPGGIAVGVDGTLRVADGACCTGAHGALIEVDQTLPNGSNQFLISDGQNFGHLISLTVVPQVAIADAAPVTEGNGNTVPANFTVTRAPFSALPLTLPFTVTSGTATAGIDVTPTSGSVAFAAGQTTTTLTVQVVGDALAEPTETFTVTLNPPNGVAIAGSGTATGTILDNDGTASLSIADVTVTEGNGGTTIASFVVTLSPASGPVVTVDYRTLIGTALTGSDFQPAVGTLTFAPGETSRTIPVPVVGDAVIEPDETFAVMLSNPTGGAVIGRSQATGTILNDDSACSPRPRVTTSLTAGGGALQVLVQGTPQNDGGANALAQLQFGTLDAAANARVTLNGQVVTSGQTVTLPAGTTSQSFTVQRITADKATTVPFTVVDGCGSWPTFVGGGTAAGF